MSRLLLLGGGAGGGLGPQWAAKPRAPLSPWPPSAPVPDIVLPRPLPATRDVTCYRGQFCGTRVAGAPVVPGSNASNPDLVMTCLLDNYPKWVQEDFLTQQAEAGFTHIQRSVGHALGYGHSMAEYNALSQHIRRDYGLYCDQWLVSWELPGFSVWKSPEDWAKIIQPIVAELLAAGVMDQCCCGWQMDQWLEPGNPTLGYIMMVAEAVPQELQLFTHWMNEAAAWWKTGGETWQDPRYWPDGKFVDNRFTFWQCVAPWITGAHYQGNTRQAVVDPKGFQDRVRDTLDPISGPTPKGYFGQSTRGGQARDFRLCMFELTGQDQFDGITTELGGDRAGYEMACTTSFNGKGVLPYGNGARRPDGTAL